MGHGRGGLLPTIVERSAAGLQSSGDAAPIVDPLPIPKEDAVDQDQRVSGAAILVFRVGLFTLPPGQLEEVLSAGLAQHAVKQDELEQRHPPKKAKRGCATAAEAGGR